MNEVCNPIIENNFLICNINMYSSGNLFIFKNTGFILNKILNSGNNFKLEFLNNEQRIKFLNLLLK